MFGTEGQKVHTLEDAARFIRTFLRYEREHRRELAQNKEHDYDLYLPWMMEVVINAPEEDGSRAPSELDYVYMDAAWALVTQGVLRPGPRRVTGDVGGDGYGKGFSLTGKGKEWLEGETSGSTPPSVDATP